MTMIPPKLQIFNNAYDLAASVCREAVIGKKSLVIIANSHNFVNVLTNITGGVIPEGVVIREALYGNSN